MFFAKIITVQQNCNVKLNDINRIISRYFEINKSKQIFVTNKNLEILGIDKKEPDNVL